MKRFLFILASVLLFPVAATAAQTPPDVCRATTSRWSIPGKIGSGIYELGWFQPATFEDETLKTFEDDETGMFVSVKVEFGDSTAARKGKPTFVDLSISISADRQEAEKFADGISSQTTYGRRWGRLSVERLITAGDLIHAFRLSCNDDRKEWRRRIFTKNPECRSIPVSRLPPSSEASEINCIHNYFRAYALFLRSESRRKRLLCRSGNRARCRNLKSFDNI